MTTDKPDTATLFLMALAVTAETLMQDDVLFPRAQHPEPVWFGIFLY